MNTGRPASADTKERILDASEYLFAQKGFRGTSMREITGRAKVNLAAVNYHFGSKKALLEAVIKRRIEPLNRVRKKRLEEVREAAEKEGRRPDIKTVLYAFIEPTVRFRESTPGAKHFFAFIGRSLTGPDDTVRKVFMRFIRPLFLLLFKTASEALPDLPRDVVFWRLQFVMGSLVHSMHICGSSSMAPLDIKMDIDAGLLIDMIIPYVTAGMKA